MGVSTATTAADPGMAVFSAIRSLLLEAQVALVRNPAAAERCIAGAVGLLPDAPGESQPTPLAPTGGKGGLAAWQVLRVRNLVEERLGERLTAADLAAVTRLSPSHFGRAFKQSFGEHPRAFVNRRRMARAKRLMLETNDSLTSIALACGLADQAHFCRLFRQHEGMTAGLWRRLHGAGRLWEELSPAA